MKERGCIACVGSTLPGRHLSGRSGRVRVVRVDQRAREPACV